MQLQQVIYYDGLSYACKQDTTCTSGNKYEDSANTELVNYDGYIFPEDQYAKRLSNGSGVSGVQSTCEGLSTSLSYITKITDGLSKSGASTSGSSTSIISDSKTAVCSTLSTLKTACSSDSSCETACTASDC